MLTLNTPIKKKKFSWQPPAFPLPPSQPPNTHGGAFCFLSQGQSRHWQELRDHTHY